MLSTLTNRIYEFEDLRLIPHENLLLQNGVPISLNPKAFAVLVMLVERHGHLVSKEQILESVWAGAFIEEGAISKAVWFVRNALGDTSKEKFIKTVPRRGYRFVAPVSVVSGSGAFRLSDLPAPTNHDVVLATVSELSLAKSPSDAAARNLNTKEWTHTDESATQASRDHTIRRSILPRHLILLLLLFTAGVSAAYLFTSQKLFQAVQPNEFDAVRSASPVLPSAEDAYFKGEYYFDAATNTPNLDEEAALFSKAISEFERAISLDERYADAHASLARTYHWLGSGGKPEAYVKSKAAALTAIQLDPSNAKAHASLAWVYWRLDWDWARAEAEYKRTLELSDGSSTELAHGYALFKSAQGRHEESIEMIRRNEESSPLSLAAKLSSAFIYLRARKYEAAEVNFRRVLELDPEQTRAISGLALTLACLGRLDEAMAVAQPTIGHNDNPAQVLTSAWVHAKAGRVREATEILRKAEKQFLTDHLRNDPYAIAKVYSALGDTDRAFEWLERAFAVRSQYLVFMGVSPEFDSISGDPRFADMLKRLGIPRQ